MRTNFERNNFLLACQLIKQAGLIYTPFFSQMVKYIDCHPQKIILAQVFVALFEDRFFCEKILLCPPKTLHSGNQAFKDKIAFANQILYVIAAHQNPMIAFENCQLSQFKVITKFPGITKNLVYHFKYSDGYQDALLTIQDEINESIEWYFFLRMLILSHDSPKELVAAFVFLKRHHDLNSFKDNSTLKKDNEKLYMKVFDYPQPLKVVASFILLNFFVRFHTKVSEDLSELFRPFKKKIQSPRFFSDGLSPFQGSYFGTQNNILTPKLEGEMILRHYSNPSTIFEKIHPLWTDLVFDLAFRTKYTLEFSLIISKLTELGAWDKLNPFEVAWQIFNFLPYWLKNSDFISFFPRLPQESKSLDLFGVLLIESEKAFEFQEIDALGVIGKLMTNIGYQMRDLADKYYDQHKFFKDNKDRPYYTLLMLFILEMQLKETPEIFGLLTDAYLQLFDFSLLQMDNLHEKMTPMISPR